MITIDNNECIHKQIMDKIRTFCIQNYLKFEDDHIFRSMFEIRGVIPRKTKGCIDEILNGFYDNETLCDCYIPDTHILYINFHKNASKAFMTNLLNMIEYEKIETVVREPCEV